MPLTLVHSLISDEQWQDTDRVANKSIKRNKGDKKAMRYQRVDWMRGDLTLRVNQMTTPRSSKFVADGESVRFRRTATLCPEVTKSFSGA